MDLLTSITAFVRVAESSGFTSAARSLGLSTTTVSDQVQALESALGVRLLNRTTRQGILAEIGREYYARARCPDADNRARSPPKRAAHYGGFAKSGYPSEVTGQKWRRGPRRSAGGRRRWSARPAPAPRLRRAEWKLRPIALPPISSRTAR